MKKFKFLGLVALAMLMQTDLWAQSKSVGGELAVGPRLGNPIGVSVKKYNAYNRSALEFIASYKFEENDISGFFLGAFWEKLAALSGNGQLSAEIGGGPVFIFGDKAYVGVGGVIGLDWRLKMAPITMSVDWLPTYLFIGGSEFSGVQAAFTVRYILNHRRTKK